MKVLQFPLIKITFCFVLGILFAQMTKPTFLLTLISLLIFSSITLIISFLSNKKAVYKSLFGIFCLITSFFIGSFTLVINNDKLNSNHYLKNLKSVENEYSAEIIIKEKLKGKLGDTLKKLDLNKLFH